MSAARSVGVIRGMRKGSSIEEALALQFRIECLAPDREFQFHPVRKWRFDFAFPLQKVGIECEGGIWVNGAHNRGAHFTSDCEKYNTAALMGWRVLRFTADMVNRGVALQMIREALT